jgi:hypothetical protein
LCAAGTALASAPDFLPLEQGNQWVYRAENGESHTISVGSPYAMNGSVYYKVRGYGPAVLLLRRADNGDLYWYDEDQERDILLTSFQEFDRGWYDTYIDGCEQGAQPQKERLEVRVPAGVFKSALEVKYRAYGCRDRGFENELYLDNLGLLKRTVSTIAGARTFELVYARVGGLRLSAEPGTSFRLGTKDSTITRESSNETPSLRTTLRLSVDRSLPVPLRYTGSQKFEVQVKNAAGDVVYAWSDDVTPAAAADQMAYELEHSLDLPLRHRSGEPLPDGQYTITGWLLAEDRPFSAATRVQILTR